MFVVNQLAFGTSITKEEGSHAPWHLVEGRGTTEVGDHLVFPLICRYPNPFTSLNDNLTWNSSTLSLLTHILYVSPSIYKYKETKEKINFVLKTVALQLLVITHWESLIWELAVFRNGQFLWAAEKEETDGKMQELENAFQVALFPWYNFLVKLLLLCF